MTWSARCSIHGSFEPALVGPKSFALLPPCGVDQWDVQATIKRINDSLIERGYVTWFDLTNMKGSVMDAMSEAVEGAEVMLYG